MNTNMEVMNRGINGLLNVLGPVETEQFISIIIRERFDYTKWQKSLFDEMSLEELNSAAAQHDHQ